MQCPTASQRAEREAPGEQLVNLTGDTTGTRVQPDQGFKHRVELLGHRLTMCSMQFVADLLGTDHDGIEAIEGLAPVLAEVPFEASIDAPVLSKHARRTTGQISCDTRDNF